jgi:hypothetical protein
MTESNRIFHHRQELPKVLYKVCIQEYTNHRKFQKEIELFAFLWLGLETSPVLE